MKRYQHLWIGLLATGLLGTDAASAQSPATTSRLTFSARFGLNISGKFSGTANVAVPPSLRTTPDGDAYNYDDGYVLPDVSGSLDGYTWYWGYDDSGSQIDTGANAILLSRSTGMASLGSPGMKDDLSPGMELVYSRELGFREDFRYGFEAALNYLNISMGGSGSYAITGNKTTDAYAFTPGTTPPGTAPGSPYQGSFNGPGYVIASSPSSSTLSTYGTVGTATGDRELEAQLWGGRIGPYAEIPLNENLSVNLSGGLALGWLNSSASWNETLMFTGGGSLADTGSGDDNAFLWGGYLAVNAHWQPSQQWSLTGGVQFQSLGTYDESFGGRRVELDLSKSFFFSFGVGYNF